MCLSTTDVITDTDIGIRAHGTRSKNVHGLHGPCSDAESSVMCFKKTRGEVSVKQDL